MLAVTRKLGGELGMHMRIDLFAGNDGVVLGEFTPWHTNGKMHCDIREILTPGQTQPTLDLCTLGKRWDRFRQEPYNSNEGGPWEKRHATTPPGIQGWQDYIFDDNKKCELARQYLRPEQSPRYRKRGGQGGASWGGRSASWQAAAEPDGDGAGSSFAQPRRQGGRGQGRGRGYGSSSKARQAYEDTAPSRE